MEYYFSSNIRNSWVVSHQPQTKETKKLDLAHLRDAVDQCARALFGVKLTPGGRWSGETNPGWLHFEVLNGGTVSSYDRFGRMSSETNFSISNLTDQFSSTDLGGGVAGFTPHRKNAVGIYSGVEEGKEQKATLCV